MRITQHLQFITLTVALLLTNHACPNDNFNLSEDFTINTFATDEQAHNICSMAIHPAGHVIVSGPGYIKILIDTNNDNQTDKVINFTPRISGFMHGMLFDGNALICTDGARVYKYTDENQDLIADGPPKTLFELSKRSSGEHAAHGIVKGADGWYYMTCGNSTGVSSKHITEPDSPIKDPVAGCILKFSPDGKKRSVVAHGFRNAYDLAFNSQGHLFTYDSDNERDHHLPWYKPSRLFDVTYGGHHGWMLPGWQKSWNRPAYFPDVNPGLVDTGRGSPVGVLVYEHHAWPKKYQNNVYFACWTMGRIYHHPLTLHNGSYKTGPPQIFISAKGNHGFAPVDIVVGKQGEMYIAAGGRGTRGTVYKVQHLNPNKEAPDTVPTAIPADHKLPRNRTIKSPLTINSESYQQLSQIRNIQQQLGDIKINNTKHDIDVGYTANTPNNFTPQQRKVSTTTLLKLIQSPPRHVRLEAARTLAMLKIKTPQATQLILNQITIKSHPTDDIHYLMSLAQLNAKYSPAQQKHLATAFTSLNLKNDQHQLITDRNWPNRVAEIYDAIAQHNPALHNLLIQHPNFGHPAHTLFFKQLPNPLTTQAKIKIINTALKQPPENLWSIQLVNLAESLPNEHLTSEIQNRINAAKPKVNPQAVPIPWSKWKTRLAKVNWDTGNPTRGQQVFTQTACAACHSGNQRSGPSLKGITQRFNKTDLFHHIVEPNLALSETYSAEQITLKDGTVYIGVPVYKSTTSTILDIGYGQTARIQGHLIQNRQPANHSPMPPALLDSATPQQLADLYAYLKTLN